MTLPWRVQQMVDRTRRKFFARVVRAVSGEQHTHERRRLAWQLLVPDTESLTFSRGDLKWTVYTGDIVGNLLFMRGHFGLDSIDGLLTFMEGRPEFSRPVIINVGANIGSSCIPLAQRTDKTIVAIEPVPRTFDLLARNIEQNGLTDRVRAVRAAVTETPGVVELMVPGDTGGSEIRASRQGFSPFIPAGAHIDVSTAEGKPLHAFVSRPEDVALVWSDTQGFETAVVRSGASLWAAGAPLWVEVWPDGLEAHGGTAPFLAACQQHFRSFVLDRDFEDHIAATIRPVSELEQVVREITVGERQDRRATTDVLLLP